MCLGRDDCHKLMDVKIHRSRQIARNVRKRGRRNGRVKEERAAASACGAIGERDGVTAGDALKCCGIDAVIAGDFCSWRTTSRSRIRTPTNGTRSPVALFSSTAAYAPPRLDLPFCSHRSAARFRCTLSCCSALPPLLTRHHASICPFARTVLPPGSAVRSHAAAPCTAEDGWVR
jgi:hypothetical protein